MGKRGPQPGAAAKAAAAAKKAKKAEAVPTPQGTSTKRTPTSASSAGVERVFSAAGKMHGDLQKSAKDSTLEHSLFAAFNTD